MTSALESHFFPFYDNASDPSTVPVRYRCAREIKAILLLAVVNIRQSSIHVFLRELEKDRWAEQV